MLTNLSRGKLGGDLEDKKGQMLASSIISKLSQLDDSLERSWMSVKVLLSMIPISIRMRNKPSQWWITYILRKKKQFREYGGR